MAETGIEIGTEVEVEEVAVAAVIVPTAQTLARVPAVVAVAEAEIRKSN